MRTRLTCILALAVLAVAMLTGCGRRGDLEPPGTAVAEERAQALPDDGISPLDPGSEPLITDTGSLGEAPEPQPIPPKNRRFFLDFLL
jgi:predicted small lipoprotein YifL